MKIDFREATPDDAAAVAGFNQQIAAETNGKTLNEELILAGVSRLLSEPARGRFWLAKVDGAMAGQSMVTYE
jgi:hypothetical protein